MKAAPAVVTPRRQTPLREQRANSPTPASLSTSPQRPGPNDVLSNLTHSAHPEASTGPFTSPSRQTPPPPKGTRLRAEGSWSPNRPPAACLTAALALEARMFVALGTRDKIGSCTVVGVPATAGTVSAAGDGRNVGSPNACSGRRGSAKQRRSQRSWVRARGFDAVGRFGQGKVFLAGPYLTGSCTRSGWVKIGQVAFLFLFCTPECEECNGEWLEREGEGQGSIRMSPAPPLDPPPPRPKVTIVGQKMKFTIGKILSGHL